MSECDVCIGTDSLDECYEFGVVEYRKARKPHTCCECGRVIAVGQQYEHAIGKYEVKFDRHDTCVLCREIRDVFTCGNSWYYGQLWEEMEDYAFEHLTTASKCFTELSAAAKAFVLERWRKWKGLP